MFPYKEVLDLEDIGCPRAKTLPNSNNVPQCYYFNHIPENTGYCFACALNQAFKYKIWYEQQQHQQSTSADTFTSTFVHAAEDVEFEEDIEGEHIIKRVWFGF